MGRGNFGGKGRTIVKYRNVVPSISCTKMAEPMEVPFGMLSQVDPRNRALDWVQMPELEGALFEKYLAHCKA